MLPLSFTATDNKTARYAGRITRVQVPVRDPSTGKPTGDFVTRIKTTGHRTGLAPFLVEAAIRPATDLLVYYDAQGRAVNPDNPALDAKSYDARLKKDSADLHRRRADRKRHHDDWI